MTDTKRGDQSEASAELLEELLIDEASIAVRESVAWQRKTQSDHVIALSTRADLEILEIHRLDGELCLRLTIDAAGVHLMMDAQELCVRASERLRIESGHITLAARESLVLESGQTIRQTAAGGVSSEAFEHEFVSTHGEVRMIANDDVALEGERVRLNSPRVRAGSSKSPPTMVAHRKGKP